MERLTDFFFESDIGIITLDDKSSQVLRDLSDLAKCDGRMKGVRQARKNLSRVENALNDMAHAKQKSGMVGSLTLTFKF